VHTGGELTFKGDKPGEFSIAGKDHQWHWADAKIEGESVVVSSPAVPEPKAVRYARQSFPTATLYNGAGLPAVPFRADDWPGTHWARVVNLTAYLLCGRNGPLPFQRRRWILTPF
jgi:hypothetical protein